MYTPDFPRGTRFFLGVYRLIDKFSGPVCDINIHRRRWLLACTGIWNDVCDIEKWVVVSVYMY